MMATKLEECARAVDCRPWLEDFGGNDATREALRKHSFAVARAVIRCLMEPSEAMNAACKQFEPFWDRNTAPPTLHHPLGSYPTAHLRAMLQSVLDEAGKE